MGATGSFEREISPAITTILDGHTPPDFEQMAIPLLNSIHNFAFWLSRDRHQAEDLVQETYRKALRGFARFEPGSNFRAWMFQILKNTFLTYCSAANRAHIVPLDSEELLASERLQSPSNSPEAIFLLESETKMVRTAIEQLPIPFREIILLCDIEEVSYREAAGILAIPIGTVMSRLSRARNALRTSLSSRIPDLASQGLATFKPA
jgi:RNA polymerase sigma-70 factor (ECF subfamily)